MTATRASVGCTGLCLLLVLSCAACRTSIPLGASGKHVASYYRGEPLRLAGKAPDQRKVSEPMAHLSAPPPHKAKSVVAPKPTAERRPEPKTTPQALSRYPLRWPLEGEVTSRYGERWGKSHDGIDIGAGKGTAVHAAAGGKVLFSDTHGTYGNLVVVKHDNGLFTVYAHNDINLVRKGDVVSQGQLIARVGASGRATGPHLHFEVRRGTAPDNPMRYLPP